MGKKIDMTGWKMWEHGIPESRIIVIEPNLDDSYKKGYWKCKCKCGNIFSAKGLNIRNGNTKSCGCLRKQLLREKNSSHLTNNIIGYRKNNILITKDLGLRKQESRNKQERWVECKCLLCGNIFESRWNNIQSGNTKTCGCISSYGEKIIADILNKNKILFKKQYSFNNLIGERGNKLRFDFGILDKENNLIKLIEFDGRQHFTGPESTWTHSHSLERIKELDEIKNIYCKNNKILLQRIPFTELKNININMLLTGIEQYYKGDDS